ncbi:MAG: hypothetical protein J3K34DRAFT_490609 [Monoraphidium minutum]|nr:MAG: hypothetical protein J3K34DRAFT_490609 [Monoraphidium minutum]
MHRPEAQATAEEWYAADAERYTSANAQVQRELTARALRLARGRDWPRAAGAAAGAVPSAAPAGGSPGATPGPGGGGAPPWHPWRRGALVLDIGCGSGLSGAALAAEGLAWVGSDLSPDMLQLAGPGSVFVSDMGQGLPLRPAAVDAAVSISAVQWLLQGPRSAARADAFFRSLRSVLRPPPPPAAGARGVAAAGAGNAPEQGRGSLDPGSQQPVQAALQLYLPDAAGAAALEAAARRAGFGAALVADWPHRTAARKYFLLLSRGGGAAGAAGGGGPVGADLTGGASCPLAFYIPATCSARWLGRRAWGGSGGGGCGQHGTGGGNDSGGDGGGAPPAPAPRKRRHGGGELEQSGGVPGAGEQTAHAQPPAAAARGGGGAGVEGEGDANAAVCRFVAEAHTRHMRKVLRLTLNGATAHGLLDAHLLPGGVGGGGSGGEGACPVCSGCGGAEAGDAGTGGGGDAAGGCSCLHVRLLASLDAPGANGCGGELLLQVVARADRLTGLGLGGVDLRGYAGQPAQQPPVGAAAAAGAGPPTPGAAAAAGGAPLSGKAARAAAAAAAAEAAAAAGRAGAALCGALGAALLESVGSRPRLLQCELLGGGELARQAADQRQRYEKQQALQRQPRRGRAALRPGGLPLPGFERLLPPAEGVGSGGGEGGGGGSEIPAAANWSGGGDCGGGDCGGGDCGGGGVSVWSVTADDCLPHPVLWVGGLPPAPGAALRALPQLRAAAAAAGAGVYGLLVLLGPGAAAAAAVCYPDARGVAAAAAAPALMAEGSRRLGRAGTPAAVEL